MLFKKLRPLALQTKVTLVILGVLVTVFSMIPFSIHRFVKPLLLDEVRRIGISTASTLADEIVDQRIFSRERASEIMENRLRELLYLQPNIRRMEVYQLDPERQINVQIASSVEEVEHDGSVELPIERDVRASLQMNEEDSVEDGWEVRVPIFRDATKKNPLGLIRLVVSVQFVSRTILLLTRVSAAAAVLGVLLLTTLLSFALRRTIENDQKLRLAQSENRVLSRQLQETEKRLMNLEKLAVMGQLTANFAHEIGTPLNAIGGHLSLLKEEVGMSERIGIIEGQLRKIAQVVRGFLQSTAQPPSQRQLVDPHRVIETTLQIVRPQTDVLRVGVSKEFDRELGPIRMVPVELEQVLLNLVNNSLDSMKEKAAREERYAPRLRVTTAVAPEEAALEITVRDNGTGIDSKDLKEILKPFFTTKAPGEGTGLGLSICRDILRRYQGTLVFESKAGEWTEAKVRIPFRNEANDATG